ncbi:MAG: hypothetical protein ABJN26_06225 [Stappiaceae bacterium]
MAKFLYENIVEILLERFPEFSRSEHYDKQDHDLPYAVWSGFGTFIANHIHSVPEHQLESDTLVVKLFEFANELMSDGDDDVQTIVVIELFEMFYVDRIMLTLARHKIRSEHISWLERQGEWLKAGDKN